MARHAKAPMTTATRSVTIRDFVIFQIKLFLDGILDWVVIPLSIGAVVLDILAGKGRRPRLFYSVVRLSERLDHWINLHGVMEHMEGESDDGFFGASKAGSDSLIGQIEQLVRGGDEPRNRKRKGDPPQV